MIASPKTSKNYLPAPSAGVLEPADFLRRLERRELAPIYLFYGEETFLLEDAVSRLTRAALQEGISDFNLDTFYGAQADGARIRDVVETLPMMSPRRLVVVKQAGELSEADWTELASVLQKAVASTTLVFVCAKIDKRKKAFKFLLTEAVSVEFKPPSENQIAGWITRLADQAGLELSHNQVVLIHQLVGSNLMDLNGELKKLADFCGTRRSPTDAEIKLVVSHLRAENIFDLTQAIACGDRAAALVCLAHLLDRGESEIGVLALISRHVRILKGVREGQARGLTGPKLSARVGVPPYFLRQYVDQSRHWPPAKLEQAFQALLTTDRALKSSPVSGPIWLENLILRICPP